MKRLLLCLWLSLAIVAPVAGFAIDDESDSEKMRPPSLRARLSDSRSRFLKEPLEVSLSMEVPMLAVSLYTLTDDAATVHYKPNSKMSWGLGLGYDGYGATVSLPVPNSERDNRSKGETQHFDLILTHYWDRGGIDLFYETYQGFYKDEGQLPSSTTGEDPIYQKRSDLSARHIGGNYYHVFNSEKFRLKAHFERGSYERKGGGSLIAMTGLNHYRIGSDKPLLEAASRSSTGTLDEKARMSSGEFLSFTLGGGYGIMQTYGAQFFRVQLLLGLGPQWQKIEFGPRKSPAEQTMLGTKVSFGIEYAYAFEFWNLGGTVKYDSVRASLGAVDLNSSVTSVLFYAKTRI